MMAVLALSAMVSCGKSASPEALAEISVTAVNCIETRGYVTDESLVDSGAPRDIRLSAYDATLARPYFVDMAFRNPSGGSWTNYDGDIHMPLYWPQGSRLSFLAYSAGSSAPKAVWNMSGSTSCVVLDVTAESLQDDILYAAADGCTPEASPVSLDFRHSQAWIEFQVSVPFGKISSFRGVTIGGVRTSGLLTVTDSNGMAASSWDFSSSMPVDCTLTPDPAAYDGRSSRLSLSVLLPRQQCRPFTFRFMTDGVERSYTYSFPESEFWYSSVHYVYKVDVAGADAAGLTKSPAGGCGISCRVSAEKRDWN